MRKSIVQALAILTLATLISLEVNYFRPDGLPLLNAAQSAVRLDQAGSEINIKDAAMLFITKRAVFVDARSQYEFLQGHVSGALCIPPSEFQSLLKALKPRLDGFEAIITYCDGERCPLSHELAGQLRAAGYKNVLVLRNGWTLWNNEKLPTERGGMSGFTPAQSEAMCRQCGK
jgi:rhodanese-related sulfurtransferase